MVMGRLRLHLDEERIYRMKYGEWAGLYKSYRQLYNFEAKRLLYKDVEDEAERYRLEHQPTVSILDL